MTTTTANATTDEAFERYLDEHAEARLESYKELVRIPSISALPEHAADCRRTAEWIAADLGRIGMEHAEVSETGGHPIVYADWLHAPNAPTVLVYCHYDVQPVDPLDLWTSPPFEPVVDGNRILGRGVADDKGQLHLHLRATEALFATRDGLPVNLKFVFEGEEESSSVHLEPWLTANRDRLAADFALISDTGFFEGNLPAITVGLRGLMYAQIDVTGTAVDLHSGGYGGVAPNPFNTLGHIIAGLKGRDGRVNVPGFYDAVRKPSSDELASWQRLGISEQSVLEQVGSAALEGELEYPRLERRWARPTLDVHGVMGGFTDEGTKTVIPSRATAKVSMRLVPDQDPAQVFASFAAFCESLATPGTRVKVREIGAPAPPVLCGTDHPGARAAAAAFEAVW